MNKFLKPSLYFFGWILAWAIVSTVINLGLDQSNVYSGLNSGSKLTYLISFALFAFGSFSLYKEVFPKDDIDSSK